MAAGDGQHEPAERRGYLPADPRRNDTLEHIGLPNISVYRREDMVMVLNHAKQGLLPPATMARLQDEIAMIIDNPHTKDRVKVSAFKALAAVWLAILKEIRSMHGCGDAQQAASVTNQQINIYLPENGREAG